MSRAERDMGADAGGVRLWLDMGFDGDADAYLPVEAATIHGVSADKPTHIAYPAAQAEAMERVVEAAVRQRQAAVDAFHARPQDRNRLESEWYAATENAQQAVAFYLATLPAKGAQ